MRRLLLLAALLPLLAACANSERSSPTLCISPSLRTVAFFAPTIFPGDAPRAVVTLDRATGALSQHTLPDFRTGDKLFYFDNRLYVSSIDRPDAAGFLLDAGTWAKAPYVDTVWYPPFLARYHGRPAVFSSQYATEVHALSDFSLLATLDLHVRGIGDGYSLRYQWPPNATPTELGGTGWFGLPSTNPDGSTTWKNTPISGIDLLDPDLIPLMHLAPPAAPAGPFTDGEAQISPDHRRLMLAPERHRGWAGSGTPDTIIPWHYTGFAVYEIPTGKLLFTSDTIMPPRSGDRPNPAEVRGTPVTPVTLTDDAVYALEETIPPNPAAANPALPHRQPNRADHQFWLTRYSAEGRQRLLQLPLSPGRLSNTFSTAASAAGRFMVIHTLDPAPRLIEVPLQPDVTQKDMRYFNLAPTP